ncbi:MAG: sigma-70 family RNA polymerase sigma factor [Planctomycetes bacterium]|nr:sigma-70 family RNA polymerase sigma factor [Planctomycetota bacterium]
MQPTNSVLLAGLADPANAAVWSEFDGRFRPLLVAFAERLRFGSSDADELAQRVLVRFAEEYRAGRYERGRGRLRSWLFGIARMCAAEQRREQARFRAARGESALDALPDDTDAEPFFEQEWRRAMVRAAFAELRSATRSDERTVRVVELLALEQRPVEEVAATLGMSVGAVYTAKHRGLARLRTILERLEDEA